jgi:hypothetical protein
VELGPEFVHGGNALLRAAFRLAGEKLHHVRRDMWGRDQAGLRRLHSYWSDLARMAARIPAGTRQPFATVLRRLGRLAPAERSRLNAFVEGFNAAPARRMSAEAIRLEHGGVDSPQSRPDRGYRPIVDLLLHQLREAGAAVLFKTPVSTVSWRRQQVEVRAAGRAFQGRAVVVTLPLGVLRAGSVRFRPRLAGKARIIRRLGWGHVARVTLRFAPGLWSTPIVPDALRRRGRANFGFLSVPGQDFPTWWTPAPRASLVVGWCGGPSARRLNRLTPRACISRALRSLAAAWNQPVSRLRSRLRGAWRHNWTTDPLARGAYSYPVAGFETGPTQLAQPLAGTIFFAGEATADELGTVHGAFASGVRAAGEVRHHLRRPESAV